MKKKHASEGWIRENVWEKKKMQQEPEEMRVARLPSSAV